MKSLFIFITALATFLSANQALTQSLVRTDSVPAAAKAAAVEWVPPRPFRLIVPYPAGGTVDNIARELASHGILGQQVVVDNRPGANGIIGSDITAKSTPDGNTILLHSISHAINATLYKKLPYDTMKDFLAVTKVLQQPNMLVAHPSIPADSVKALVELAKSKPSHLTYASPGSGSSPHLAGELFKMMAGIDITHVPYRGGPQAMTDLLAGRVSLSFQSVSFSMPLVKAGKVKAIAVTGAMRSKAAPDLPTVAEFIPGYEASTWYGIFVPAGTPAKNVAKLHGALVATLLTAQVRDRLTSNGAEIVADTSEHFAAAFRADIAKWGRIVTAAGVRND